MTDNDLKKIGDEMIRVLEPVYEQLDKIESTLSEHTDKIDALTVGVHQLHQELGAFKDKTNSDVEAIKQHIGMSSNLS